MKDVAIVSAVRTAVGRAKKGSLAKVRMDDMGAAVVKEAIKRAGKGFDPKWIEDVLIGCAMPEGVQGMNVARMVSILAGVPLEAGAATMNRFCGSSMQTLHDAARAIMVGDGDTFIVGGIEDMSNVPMGGFNVSLNPKLYRNPELPDAYIPMGITAENVARKHEIGREAQDEFACSSHMKAVAAIAAGQFKDEILPVTVPDGMGGTKVFDVDDCPRADTSIGALARLKPAFVENGTVTAGNSSPTNDGAAAMVVMDAAKAAKNGIKPLAYVRGMAVAGLEPEYMGLGPVPAIKKVLARVGKKLSDIDWFELNEAFAAQSLGVVKLLDIDTKKVNPRGGAIAIGHPLGCSGSRIVTTLVHDFKLLGGTWGIASMCIGGGQGIATVIEYCG